MFREHISAHKFLNNISVKLFSCRYILDVIINITDPIRILHEYRITIDNTTWQIGMNVKEYKRGIFTKDE